MAKRRMRFITWCKKDINDVRPINYTFKSADGKIHHFTSENTVTPHMMNRVRYSWVESIELTPENTWNVVIYED